MEEELETPTTITTTTTTSNGGEASNNGDATMFHEFNMYTSDIDSTCSTPYVSAPSSPGRGGSVGGGGGGGFFYSAPASPMHFVLCSSSPNSTPPASSSSVSGTFEFDFSSRLGKTGPASAGSMISADELFLNGQIRPMKLSTHLQRPQVLAPLLDLDETEIESENNGKDDGVSVLRGRDVKWRDRSLRRRTRSMSPLRTSSLQWHESDDEEEDQKNEKMQSTLGIEAIEIKENEAEAEASGETTPSISASSSRSSSVSRSSKRWVFLKEFLYRSKSEGRNTNNGHKFWSSISFSPVKEKKVPTPAPPKTADSDAGGGSGDVEKKKNKAKQQSGKEPTTTKKKAGGPSNGVGKRRRGVVPPPSAHELHYKANREKAEEMRKKTFLPYREGVLGCLGFSSKSYGAMNGFARALNPVSSR